jgi:hypothetical protein
MTSVAGVSVICSPAAAVRDAFLSSLMLLATVSRLATIAAPSTIDTAFSDSPSGPTTRPDPVISMFGMLALSIKVTPGRTFIAL